VLLWRDLWIALAEAERGLGLPISEAQVEALRAAREQIDFARVAELEAKLRHDVMAHVHHFGEVAGADHFTVLASVAPGGPGTTGVFDAWWAEVAAFASARHQGVSARA